MRIIRFLVLAAVSASLSAACSEAPVARGSAARPAIVKAPPTRPQPFPFWTAKVMEEKDRTGAATASGAAYPIAPGFFLVACTSMGQAAADMAADPSVTIADGTVLHDGTFVDVDMGRCIGLIRSDFSPPAYPIAKGLVDTKETFTAHVIALREDTSKPSSYRVADYRSGECAVSPVTNPERRKVDLLWSCESSRDALPGSAITVRGSEELIAVLSKDGPSPGEQASASQSGVGPSGPRFVLDHYFASGGRGIRPRPSY
ncbi:MAG: hypothetical protein RLZZ324_322 [Candidatus Parcubacteria bacterium]|jgi:hypothetical protein